MKLLLKFLDHTCRVYTVTAVLLLLLQMAIAGGADTTVIRPEAFLLVLPFAVSFALADLLYGAQAVAFWLRQTAHFVAVVLAAFLFLYMPLNQNASSSKLVFVLLAVVIYWICMGTYLAISVACRRSAPKKSEYKSVFKK